MNWNAWVRQIHRWVSIAFTLTYSPLPPLALLALTGLYMFVLPYAAKRRGARRAISHDAA